MRSNTGSKGRKIFLSSQDAGMHFLYLYNFRTFAA